MLKNKLVDLFALLLIILGVYGLITLGNLNSLKVLSDVRDWVIENPVAGLMTGIIFVALGFLVNFFSSVLKEESFAKIAGVLGFIPVFIGLIFINTWHLNSLTSSSSVMFHNILNLTPIFIFVNVSLVFAGFLLLGEKKEKKS